MKFSQILNYVLDQNKTMLMKFSIQSIFLSFFKLTKKYIRHPSEINEISRLIYIIFSILNSNFEILIKTF